MYIAHSQISSISELVKSVAKPGTVHFREFETGSFHTYHILRPLYGLSSITKKKNHNDWHCQL